MLQLIRELTCLQLDPISAVARSHLLVLWSRLGNYDPAVLDRLLWEDRSLFEYWAHAASIVPTEDYPFHRVRMARYPDRSDPFGPSHPYRKSVWTERIRDWMATNAGLRRYIRRRLEAEGPLALRAFEDVSRQPWGSKSSGWNAGRNVSRMLDFLWIKGEVMVAGRVGGQKLWDLSTRVLPQWTPRRRLSQPEYARRAALRSLSARGIARAKDIADYFLPGRNDRVAAVMSDLERAGAVERVRVVGPEGEIRGPWFMRPEDIELAERIEAGEWAPRTTLLSPFDNLLRRPFIATLFNFHFKTEIYVPKDKRQYGYYLLPILQGERLVGRVDAYNDRKKRRLEMRAVHAEPGVDGTVDAAELRSAMEDMATFVGAEEIVFGATPASWATALKS